VRDPHSHPEIRLTLVRRGRARYSRAGEETEVGPGDVIVALPDERHSLAVADSEALNICELVIDTSTDG
jgi:quercetin dioxygenase-like cupin family protein